MKRKSFTEQVQFYQQRFAFQPPQIKEQTPQDSPLIIVIPAYNEPDIIGTLESLKACDESQASIEVIILINHAANSSNSIKKAHQDTYLAIKSWIQKNSGSQLVFRLLLQGDLAPKYAGVGLARKIGMDEALARFAQIGRDGGIVCLDADCRVAKNYLRVLEEAFEKDIYSASIYFEHREEGLDSDLKAGIEAYELFLRYYVQALKYSTYPRAFHTVGSSMAVRASIYAQSGGMNRRKAGEDFYFLHKISAYGKHLNISETCVYPSGRISNRVPFGTGRAQEKWQENPQKDFWTYSPKLFNELKAFFSQVPSFYSDEENLLRQSDAFPHLATYLKENAFLESLKEIRSKSSKIEVFLKHFWAKFDGLQVLKAVHHLRDQQYGEMKVEEAAQLLLGYTGREKPSQEKLLQFYRRLDRE